MKYNVFSYGFGVEYDLDISFIESSINLKTALFW